MTLELISLLVRANLVLAAAILLVLLLRGPARRAFGARLAYALWLIPPLAAAMCFAPERVEHVVLPAEIMTSLPLAAVHPTQSLTPTLPPLLVTRVLLALWAGGVLIHLGVLALRQFRFVGALGRLQRRADLGARVFEAESSAHGPAVIGVLRPVIVTPADFEQRFSGEEQAIVLAHERAHMAQGDPLINAAAALLQCLNWFNPLIHVAQRALRADQELACDAAVLAAQNAQAARRPYAEAILKTQIGPAAPLGCAWPSPSQSSLKERIAMLKSSLPSPAQRLLGVSVVAVASFAACAAAWSAQPARVVVTTEATPQAAPVTPLPPDPLAAIPTPKAQGARLYLAQAPSHHHHDNTDDDDSAAPTAPTPPTPATPSVAPTPQAVPAPAVPHIAPVPPTPPAALDGGDGHQQHFSYHSDNGHGVVTMDGRTYRWEDLSPEQRAQIQARIDLAMQRSREARERALEAGRVAREQGMQARREAMVHAQEAMREASRANRIRVRGEDVDMSPEMRAELRAVTEEASRMATIAAAANSDEHREELQRMRADMEQHAQRLREMAAHMRTTEERAPHADSSHDHGLTPN